MARYEVRAVADAQCSGLRDEILFESDDLDEAEQAASEAAETWGTGIEDTKTGLIDYGFGFGVDVPEMGF